MEAAEAGQMIPILGMHRSGTSALAGAMHKLGADLGDEGLWTQPATDNPRGFFEYRPVLELNREILSIQGGSWSAPPALPRGWEDAPELDECQKRAQDILIEMRVSAVVKDPQLSLTLPLWVKVGNVSSAILCLRNPVSVANSLMARNGFSVDQGLFLWFRYNAAAIRNCPDALVLEYEALLEDPAARLQQVADHIGLEVNEQSITMAAETVSQQMAHHEEANLPDTATGVICGRLYGLLRAKANDGRHDDDDLTPWLEVLTELPWPGAGDREINRARREVTLQTDEIKRLQSENAAMQARLERLQRELDDALQLVDSKALDAVLAAMDSLDRGGP